MKTAKYVFLLAVLLVTPALGGYPSSQTADLKAEVSGILSRFPAVDTAERDSLCAELVRLGPDAIIDICSRLVPPGEGDNSKAEFALNGLAVHVTRPEGEKERQAYIRALISALGRSSSDDVAAFLISQIELAGRDEAAKPLAKYLHNERLVEPAARALMTIGTPAAAKALLKALDSAPATAKMALIKTLGEFRSRAAVKRIISYAEGSDEHLRRAALFALANIGDPRAAPILEKVRIAAPAYERDQAPSVFLLYAERLIQSGNKNLGLEICRDILGYYRGPGESHIASSALNLMAPLLKDEIWPYLFSALDHPDPEFRGAALALAGKTGGTAATELWIESLATSPAQIQAEIIAMLGDREDPAALPAVREALQSQEKIVRLAAIRAFAKLGGNQALPDILQFVESGLDTDEIEAAKEALLGMPGPLVVPEAVRLLDSAPPLGRAALIGILAAKGAREHIDLVFAQAGGMEPEVRAAAVQALADLAGENDLPRLLEMLFVSSNSADIVNLQNAVAASVLRNPAAAQRADLIIGYLETATPEKKLHLLRVLPRIGGARALEAVIKETSSEDSRIRGVAVHALSLWPDFAAADKLLLIISKTEDRRHLLLALDGYARLVMRGRLPEERKFCLLKDVLSIPENDADKKTVLRALAQIRSPEVFSLLSDYLKVPALTAEVTEGLLDMASVQSPEERWLSGHEAISILRRVETHAPDSVTRERASRIIADRLKQGGFVPLFNGRGLKGWKGLVADPPNRAEMTTEELRKAQAEADERMAAHWKAAGGILVFDGKGESLCTARNYADFELLVDWKIEGQGDSGIYLRGSPQVQIWDAEANPAGSGGLYNNQQNPNQPLEKADRPVGEWNAFRIIMIGERVTVYLNDKMVVNNTVLENYWERDKPIYETGQIELQAHGNPLSFRNIYIREIPRAPEFPAALPESEKTEGFVALFNGHDLAGWTGDTNGYTAEDGKIVIHPGRGSGNLYTEKEYGDFVLRFDFRLSPAANNGLGIRAPLEGDAAYLGLELQILEDASPVFWNLRPYQYHGSIYGLVPARRGILKPVGEWNTEEVIAEGRQIKVVVNGTTIVDADIEEAAKDGTMDKREHPGLKRDRGHIGFLGHGSIVEFRNIRIKELE